MFKFHGHPLSFIGIPCSSFIGTPDSSFMGIPDLNFIGTPNSSFIGTPDSSFIGIPYSSFIGTPYSSFTGIPDSSFIGTPNSSFISSRDSSFTGTPNSSFIGTPYSRRCLRIFYIHVSRQLGLGEWATQPSSSMQHMHAIHIPCLVDIAFVPMVPACGLVPTVNEIQSRLDRGQLADPLHNSRAGNRSLARNKRQSHGWFSVPRAGGSLWARKQTKAPKSSTGLRGCELNSSPFGYVAVVRSEPPYLLMAVPL